MPTDCLLVKLCQCSGSESVCTRVRVFSSVIQCIVNPNNTHDLRHAQWQERPSCPKTNKRGSRRRICCLVTCELLRLLCACVCCQSITGRTHWCWFAPTKWLEGIWFLWATVRPDATWCRRGQCCEKNFTFRAGCRSSWVLFISVYNIHFTFTWIKSLLMML